MPLITGSSSLDTNFTPAVGPFWAQVRGGAAILLASPTGTAGTFTPIRAGVISNEAVLVDNPIAGVVYQFNADSLPTPAALRADQ